VFPLSHMRELGIEVEEFDADKMRERFPALDPSRFKSDVVEVVRQNDRVAGVRLSTAETVNASVVVNVAGPWSAALNELAGVLGDFATSTRPLEQEVVSGSSLDRVDGG